MSENDDMVRVEAFREALRDHYRSGGDQLARDFFGPALAVATLYRRSVGYFTTTALVAWAEALMRMAAGHLAIRLIACPELAATDLAVLRNLQSAEARARKRALIADQAIESIVSMMEEPSDAGRRAAVFAWLVATDRLQIRFAFAEHVEDAGIYHEKIGVVDLADGSRIAFTGSANETDSGHRRNYESVDVFRDWVPSESGRVSTKAAQFDEAWQDKAAGLRVLAPSSQVLNRLRARAPKVADASPAPAPPGVANEGLWPHQVEALQAFLEMRVGVLEMATGTGKTRTALAILSRLADAGRIQTAVIAMDGTDLLDQWCDDLRGWLAAGDRRWLLYRQYERHHEVAEFGLDPAKSVLVISRGQLVRLKRYLPAVTAQRAIIVHDEVHGLGAPALVAELEGFHAAFDWRLGLSATPERAYDDDGNAFLERELGPTVYAFPLEAAIRRGVLSEFDYEPLPYELTVGDRQRLKLVYSRQASRAREGRPMAQQELWTELARVYKTAEAKPEVFQDRLERDPSVLRRCIIFVETREYGVPILAAIDQYTHRYRTYYADDDRAHLVAFANGDIDCLVTCHRISQGIDIRSLNTVVLFASARARLETIQRIGRCLRVDPKNPGKRARVIDFVRPQVEGEAEPNADQERAAWLRDLSEIRRDALRAD